ncbi:RNA recognition motif domain-containing protein [Acidobacteriota bacterium]
MRGKVLFVGNIDPAVNREELAEEFSYFGIVRYINIIKSKGIGFVKMSRFEDAERAVCGLNGIEVKGRKIRVEMAHPHEKGS